MVKKLLWIVAIAALLYGGYIAYEYWWESGRPPGEVRGASTRILSAAEGVWEKVKEAAHTFTTRVVGEAEQTFTEAAKEKAGDLIAPLGEQITSFAGTLSGGDGSSSAGGTANIPAATGSTFSVLPPAAAIVVKPNMPITFSVNRVSSYTVDWGDGMTEKGTVPKDRITLLTHAWTAAGDYSVNVNLEEDGSSHAYLFPIRVIEP